jgi:capsular exopolysaccharide synthesis family protein
VNGADDHVVSLVAPRSMEAEQYRVLRHGVEQKHHESGLQVVAVTSAAAGDGKTLTSVNLAGALAQSPQSRVLLIDADLRCGTVHELLRLGGGRGLVDAIVDETLTLDDVTRQLTRFNLAAVPVGRTAVAPYELLKSPRFAALLAAARTRYQYVVVDTPPVALLPDARLIEQWIDGVVVVVAAHKTPRRLVEAALDVMSPDKMLGIVWNREHRPASNYGYYAGYGHAANGHRAGWWSALAKRIGSRPRPSNAQ